MTPAFEAISDGFHITFPNGYTVSAVWGPGSYSDRGETTAEVAVWDTRIPSEPFVRVEGLTNDYDQVAGRVTASQLAWALQTIAAANPGDFPVARMPSLD